MQRRIIVPRERADGTAQTVRRVQDIGPGFEVYAAYYRDDGTEAERHTYIMQDGETLADFRRRVVDAEAAFLASLGAEAETSIGMDVTADF